MISAMERIAERQQADLELDLLIKVTSSVQKETVHCRNDN